MTEKAEKIELLGVQPVKSTKKRRGPGRPPKPKSQRIRDLDAVGIAPKLIAERLGVSLQQVYSVRYADKKKQALASKSKPQKRWAEPKLLPMPTENATPVKPVWAVPTQPKPTFWQRVKAVFFPN